MNNFLKDLRQTARALRKNAGIAAMVAVTLGLGICATTSTFSFVNTVVLRPFPFAEPDRLVRVWGKNLEQDRTRSNVAVRDILDLREASTAIESITAFSTGSVTLTGGEEAVQLRATMATANFFSVLGVEAAPGGAFREEEETPGKGQIVVLSDRLWKRHLGADPDIVGKELTLDNASYTVVGVAPEDFEHPVPNPRGEPDLWRPMAIDLEHLQRTDHWAKAVGRLNPGVSLASAQAEMDTMTRRLEAEYPDSNAGWHVHLEDLQSSASYDLRPALYILFTVMACVLVLICFNLAGLQLARGIARQRDLSVRTALGAHRSHLIRLLTIESLFLAGLGGAVGLALTPVGLRLMVSLSPATVFRLNEVTFDAAAFVFTLVTAGLAGLLFGVFPAFRVSKVDVQTLLKEGEGRGATGSRGQNRLRSLLVTAQVSISVILLVAGGLLVRSFLRLIQVDPGINPANVVTMDLSLPVRSYPEVHDVRNFYQRALDRIASIPGVESVGSINMLPFTSRYSCNVLFFSDGPKQVDGEYLCAEYRSVGKDYFQTLGIRLVRGRLPDERDHAETQRVAVASRSAVRRFWGDEDPIGKQIQWASWDAELPWHTIVGVVEDVRHRGLDNEALTEIYVPHAQDDSPRTMTLVVRTHSDPLPMVPAMREAVRTLDKNLPVYGVHTMESRISDSLWLERLGAVTLSFFSGMALLLAVLGLYSLISYMVAQRSHEFGIRMALGAGPKLVLRMVVGQGLRLAAVGLVIGLAGAAVGSRWIASRLFGIDTEDPFTFVAVSLILVFVALFASYVPARKASRTDPIAGLRSE